MSRLDLDPTSIFPVHAGCLWTAWAELLTIAAGHAPARLLTSRRLLRRPRLRRPHHERLLPRGPGLVYDIVTGYPTGHRGLLDGRNEENSWFRSKEHRC